MARTAAEKTEKKEQATLVLDDINKKFGQGSIFRLGDKSGVPVETISTGIIGIDAASGVGGFARGKIIEIYSDTGCGKSCLTLQVIANAQKRGLKCAILDTEHALSLETCAMLGVNVDDLFVSQPSSGNESLEICEMLVKSGDFGVVVVDSVAALVPTEEINGDYGDAVIGRQAKLMNQACRKMTAAVGSTNTCLIFTNQIRANLQSFGYGDQTVTTGGMALKFFSSMRLELKRMQQIKSGDEISGHHVKATFKKNRCAAPFKTAEYEITYGQNSVKFNELVDLGVEYKFIDKGGAWYTYNGERWQGKENAKAFLMQNPEVANQLETKIRGFLGLEVANA